MSNPQTISVREQHALLEELIVTQGTTKQFRKGVRNTAIALCMLEAGLRVGEVIKLKVSDLWFNDAPVESLLISSEKSKTNEKRQIPVSTRLADAIKEMHRCYWWPDKAVAYGFAFYQNNFLAPLTTRQVERIIRSAAIAALGRPIHPHVLRHTFATKLMKVTNLRVVQEMLGHQHIQSTQIYTHPDIEDKKTAIEKASRTAKALPCTSCRNSDDCNRNSFYDDGKDRDFYVCDRYKPFGLTISNK